jgi:hypothetical protein
VEQTTQTIIQEQRKITMVEFQQAAEKLLWYGGNSMAHMSMAPEEHRAGCSKRPSSKAAASEEAKAYASVR